MSSRLHIDWANEFREEYPAPLVYWRKQYWQYTGAHYRLLGNDAEFSDLLWKWVEGRDEVPKRSLIADAVSSVRANIRIEDSQAMPGELGSTDAKAYIISLANCRLDLSPLRDGKDPVVLEHTSNWFTTSSLPYAYEPGAGCPRWLRFLDQVMESDTDRIKLLQEWFGLCCVHDTSYEKAMFWEGEGRNGKSQAERVLIRLVGADNVSSVPLEDLDGRFNLITTFGKLLNTCMETDPRATPNVGLLKRIISGELVKFEAKGQPIFSAPATVRLLFAMNERARIRDFSDAIWRRLLVVPWRFQVPLDDVVPNLGDTIADEELSGIFLWAIEGLKRLWVAERFTESEVVQQTNEDYRTERDPVRAALLALYEFDPDGRIPTTDIDTTRQQYCLAHDLPIINIPLSTLGKTVGGLFGLSSKAMWIRGLGTRQAWPLRLKIREEELSGELRPQTRISDHERRHGAL